MTVPEIENNTFPAIADCLPHAGEMVLLDEILAAGQEFAECSVVVGADSLLHTAVAEVPVWVGIEYMAQCAAIFAGLSASDDGPKVGFLLGSRKVTCSTEAFYPGQELRVRAEIAGTFGTMCSFNCSVVDRKTNDVLITGKLNVYLLED